MNSGNSADAGARANEVGLWSTATGIDPVAAGEAMRRLADGYWYPVYVWWRRVGCNAMKAASATEACFSRWIEREPARPEDPGAARWRGWLLRRLPVLAVMGVKPWPAPLHTIDRTWAEARYAAEPGGSPDALLARALALAMLESALETLRSEDAAAGLEDEFATLVPRLRLESGEVCDPAVEAFRERFGTTLRAIVADTLADPEDVDSELTALRDAANSPGNDTALLPTSFAGLTPDDFFACGLSASTAAPVAEVRAPAASATEEMGRLFPHYEILELLGKSALGAVFQARQTTLDRLVAIKLLPAAAGADRDFAARFLREAEAMARLHHENIVTVHDFGETAGGHLFVVMEYVDGAALDARLQEARLPQGAALHVATQMCSALAFAHDQGVVHGDLKPANVLLSRAGVVKVADFGVTRPPDGVSGAPAYLAPEQKQALEVDQRADIFAVGVIVYEMLCGEVPLGLCDPPSVRAGADRRLDAIVRRATQSEPEQRFQTIDELRAALEQVRDTPCAPVPEAVEPVPSAIVSPVRRITRWQIGAAAAALLLAIAGGIALKPEKETLTAAQKVALARAAQPTPAPLAEEATPAPAPKKKPAARKRSTPAPAAKPPPEAASAPSTPAPMVAVAQATPPPTVVPTAAATPTPAATPAPQSEFAKWLTTTSAQMQAAYQREVRAPFDAGVAGVRRQYVAVIDASIAAAQAAGKRDLVLALRAERQRVESGQAVAEGSAAPAIPELKPLRATWRTQFTKLDKERFERAKALHARYDPALAQQETRLTEQQKLDDARAIKARRAEIAAAWLVPPAASVATAPGPVAPSKGKLAPLPVLARLLSLNARVHVRNAPGRPRYEVRTTADLKSDTFEFQEVEFRTRPEGGAAITDSDLAILEQLPDLTDLVINGVAVTDAAIDQLRHCRALHDLRLENLKNVTSKSFEALASLPELRSLALVNLPVGDDAIATVAQLSKLTKLRISDLPISDAALAAVAAMPAVEDLEFGGGKIRATSAAWEHITKMRKLTRLACKASEVDGVVTGYIAQCVGLTRLNFEGRPMTDAALAPLSALSRLVALNVGGTKVTGTAFKNWPVRPALVTLYLDDCPGLDDSVLRAIATAFPKLEDLEIGGAAGALTLAGAAELVRLRQLKTLRVQGEAATDAIAPEIARIETLTELNLDQARLTEAGLNALAKLPRLWKLNLDNPPITDGALKALKRFRALKEIVVGPDTPSAIFTRLSTDLPGITIRR